MRVCESGDLIIAEAILAHAEVGVHRQSLGGALVADRKIANMAVVPKRATLSTGEITRGLRLTCHPTTD